MEKQPELLKDFPAVSREQWKAKAIEDLKGADFSKLIWKTYDGIAIQPFYTREDIQQTDVASHHALGNTGRKWVNYAEIRVEEDMHEANRIARKMLDYDTSGFLFYLTNPDKTDLEILLQGLDPERLHISFKTDHFVVQVIQDYFEYLKKQQVSLKIINGFYESDELENLVTQGTLPAFDTYKNLVRVTLQAPGFYGLAVKSHAFANSGANITQEMAFTLNKVVELTASIADEELPAQVILDEVMLHMAVGADYFFEIAKLRALRILFRSVAECFDVESPSVNILSSSSLWSKTLFDPNVNMLRNTTEAMSAVLGGCDALLIQPHDSSYKQPTDFSRRVAVNISNILKEEAYLNKIVDPAGGSYYLEHLTSQLVKKGLEIFQEVESKGGFIAAFEAGEISRAIQGVRDQKLKDVASRKQIAVGTNKYPNLQETVAYEETANGEDGHLLNPQRSTRAFNQLRLSTQKHLEETGFVPKVYLACFGNLAMRKARATFAAEFFGTAGFHLMGEFAFQDVSSAAKEAAASEADIVVMCSSDPDYESVAVAFSTLFKAEAPSKLLVLAGYPAALINELKTAGVDEFIHIKTNAVETLSGFQNKLFTQHKIA